MTSTPHPHSHRSHSYSQPNAKANGNGNGNGNIHDEFATLHMFLEAHFGDVSQPQTQMVDGKEDELLVIDVTVDGIVARIDLISIVGLRQRGLG